MRVMDFFFQSVEISCVACQDYLTPFPPSKQLQNIVVWLTSSHFHTPNFGGKSCKLARLSVSGARGRSVRTGSAYATLSPVCVCLYSKCIIGAYFLLAPLVALTLWVCD